MAKLILGEQGVIGRTGDGEELRLELLSDGEDIYITANGTKIAKRGRPGTAQAKTWISLEPGWEVTGFEELNVTYNEPSKQ